MQILILLKICIVASPTQYFCHYFSQFIVWFYAIYFDAEAIGLCALDSHQFGRIKLIYSYFTIALLDIFYLSYTHHCFFSKFWYVINFVYDVHQTSSAMCTIYALAFSCDVCKSFCHCNWSIAMFFGGDLNSSQKSLFRKMLLKEYLQKCRIFLFFCGCCWWCRYMWSMNQYI